MTKKGPYIVGVRCEQFNEWFYVAPTKTLEELLAQDPAAKLDVNMWWCQRDRAIRVNYRDAIRLFAWTSKFVASNYCTYLIKAPADGSEVKKGERQQGGSGDYGEHSPTPAEPKTTRAIEI